MRLRQARLAHTGAASSNDLIRYDQLPIAILLASAVDRNTVRYRLLGRSCTDVSAALRHPGERLDTSFAPSTYSS